MTGSTSSRYRSRTEDGTNAVVRLLLELHVSLSGVFKWHVMGDEKSGVETTLLDVLE
jgi:hypothetical protein